MGMLKDKVSIITGSGRGIGRATALLFSSEGAKVVVNDIDAQQAGEVVEAITIAGGRAVAVTGDITSDGFAGELIKKTVEAYGPNIDILVNNAGYIWDGVVHKMTDRQWQAIIDIHVTAPFKIIRAASPYMRDNAVREKKELGRAGCRKIINVSSVSGLDGNAGQANYSSAKAALIGLTKTLSREWGPFNICVNCVAFGLIDSRGIQAGEKGNLAGAGGVQVPLGIPEQVVQFYNAVCPMGRPGTAEEAAGSILLLAAPLADYINGQVIRVSGGF